MFGEEFSLGVSHLNRVYISTIKSNRDQQDQEQRLYHILPTFLKLFAGNVVPHAPRTEIIARHFSELHHFANLASRVLVTELKRRAAPSPRYGSNSSEGNGSSTTLPVRYYNNASFAIAEYLMPNVAPNPQPPVEPTTAQTGALSATHALTIAFSPGYQLMQSLRLLSANAASVEAADCKLMEMFCSSHVALPSTLVKSLYLLFDLPSALCQAKRNEFALMRESLLGLLLNLLGHHYACEELCRRDDLVLLFVAVSAPCARHVLVLQEGAARLLERMSTAATLTQPVLAYIHNKHCLKIVIDQLRSHVDLDEAGTTATLSSLFYFLQIAGAINRLMLDDFCHVGGYEFLASYIVRAAKKPAFPADQLETRIHDDIVYLIKMTGVLCLVGNHSPTQQTHPQSSVTSTFPDFVQPIAKGPGHTVTNIYAVRCLVDIFLQQSSSNYHLAHVLLDTILHLYYLDDANYFIIESSGCSALCQIVERISTTFSMPPVSDNKSNVISFADQYLNVLDHVVQQVHCIPVKELSTIAINLKQFFQDFHKLENVPMPSLVSRNILDSSTSAVVLGSSCVAVPPVLTSATEFARKTLLLLRDWLVGGYGFVQFQESLLAVGILDVLVEEVVLDSNITTNAANINHGILRASNLAPLPDDVHQLACDVLQLAVMQNGRNASHLRTHDTARRISQKISSCMCRSAFLSSTTTSVTNADELNFCARCQSYAGLLVSLLASGATGCEDDVQAVIVVFNQCTGKNDRRVQVLLLRCLCAALAESHRARMALRKTGGFVALVSALVSLADCLRMDDTGINGGPEFRQIASLAGKKVILVFIRTIFETLAAALRYEPANTRHFAEEIRWRSLLDAVRMLGCFGSQVRFGTTFVKREQTAAATNSSLPVDAKTGTGSITACGAFCSSGGRQQSTQYDTAVQASLNCFMFQPGNWDVALLLYPSSSNVNQSDALQSNTAVSDAVSSSTCAPVMDYSVAFCTYVYKCLYFLCLDLFRYSTKLLSTNSSSFSRAPSPLSGVTTPARSHLSSSQHPTGHFLSSPVVGNVSGRRSSPSSRQSSLQRSGTIDAKESHRSLTQNALSERPLLYPEVALVMLKLLPALYQQDKPDETQGFGEMQLFATELIRSMARTERNQQVLCNVGMLHELLDMCYADNANNGAGVLTNDKHPLHSSLIFLAERLANQSLEANDLRYFISFLLPPRTGSAAEVDENLGEAAGADIDPNLISLSRVKTLVSMITPRDDYTNLSLPATPTFSSSPSASYGFPPAFVEFDLTFEGFGGLHIPSLAPQATLPLISVASRHQMNIGGAGGGLSSTAMSHAPSQQLQQQRMLSGESQHSGSMYNGAPSPVTSSVGGTGVPLSPSLSNNSSAQSGGAFQSSSSPIVGGIGSGERMFPPPAGMTVAMWFNIECYDKAEPVRLLDIFRTAGNMSHVSSNNSSQNFAAEALRCFSLHIVNNSNNLRTPCICLSTAELLQSVVAAPPPAFQHQPSIASSAASRSPIGRNLNSAHFSSSISVTNITPPPSGAANVQTSSVTASSADFVCIEAPQLAETSRWYHIAVVLSRAIIKQSSAAVYVDGQRIANIKMPYINQYPGVGTTNLTPARNVFGLIGTMPAARRQCRLRWKLATLAVVEEALTPVQIAVINSLGPAYHGSFQDATLGSNNVSVSGPLVAEERILFGLSPSVVSEMTIQKLKRVYNKEDAKAAARFLQLSPGEMSVTPVKLLHNSAAHLRGAARSIGAVVVGFLGFRSFMPRPPHQALISVGGVWCLLGLVAMSKSTEFLYAAIKCLTCSLRANFMLRDQMRKYRGHELLAMMLKKKHHLLNSHVIQLVFAQCCVSDGDGKDQNVHILYDRALQELFCDLHLWQLVSPNTVRTIFGQLRELAKENADNAAIMRRLGLFTTLQHFLLLLPSSSSSSTNVTATERSEVDPYCTVVDAAFMLMDTLVRTGVNPNDSAVHQQQVGAITAREVIGLAQALASTLQPLQRSPHALDFVLHHAIRERGLLLMDALQREQLPQLIPQVIGFDWLLSFLTCSSSVVAPSNVQHTVNSAVIIALQMLLDLLVAPPQATISSSSNSTAVAANQNFNCVQIFREGKNFGNWLRDGNLWAALCMSSDASVMQNAGARGGSTITGTGGAEANAKGLNFFGSRSGPESSGFTDVLLSGGGFGGLQAILADPFFCSLTPAWAAVVALLTGRPLALHQFMPLAALRLDDIWMRIFGTPPGQPVKLKGLKLVAGREAAQIGLAMVRAEMNSDRSAVFANNSNETTTTKTLASSSCGFMQLLTYMYHNWSEFAATCCLTPDFIGALVTCSLPMTLSSNSDVVVVVAPTRKVVLDLLKTLVIDSLSLPQNKCDAALSGGLFDYPIGMLCANGGDSAELKIQTFFDKFVPIVIEHIQAIEILTAGSRGGLPLAVGGSFQNLPLNVGLLLHKFIDRMWRSSFSSSSLTNATNGQPNYCILSRNLIQQLADFVFSTALLVLLPNSVRQIPLSSTSSSTINNNASPKFDASTIACVTKALHRLVLYLISRPVDSVSSQMELLDYLHKILDCRSVVFATDALSGQQNEFVKMVLMPPFYCRFVLCLVQLYQHVNIRCDPKSATTWHVPKPPPSSEASDAAGRVASRRAESLSDKNHLPSYLNTSDDDGPAPSTSDLAQTHATSTNNPYDETQRGEGWKLIETTTSHLWDVMRSYRQVVDVLLTELTFRPQVSAAMQGGLQQLPLEALARETVALDECRVYWMQMLEIESSRGGGGQHFQQQLTAAATGTSGNLVVTSAAVSSAVVGVLAAGARTPKQLAQNLMRSFQRQKARPQFTGIAGGTTWSSSSSADSFNQNIPYTTALVQAHNAGTVFVQQLRLHCALVRNYYVNEYLEQLQRELVSLTRLTEDDWRESELEFLLRERALWGSEQPWRLQKWKLTTCEGYNRMRKKLVPNERFYLDYPSRRQPASLNGPVQRNDTDLDAADSASVGGDLSASDASAKSSASTGRAGERPAGGQIKYRLPTSADSELLFTNDKHFVGMNDNENLPAATAQRLPSLLFETAAMKKQNQPFSAAHHQPTQVVAPAADSIDAAGEAIDDAEKPTIASEQSAEAMPTNVTPDNKDQQQTPPPTTTARYDPILEDILIAKFMEEGDTISHVYRCARVQGLDTFEGLLLFGREHLYAIDGYTLLRTREIRDIETIPSAQREPVLPMVVLSLGSKKRQKLRYADIREVLCRRYLLQPIALEIFCANGRTNFIAFPRTYRDRVLARLLSLAPNITDSASSSVAGQKRSAQVEPQMSLLGGLIGETSVTQRWLRGEITNFQYLMHLNTLAGRSYNDLMQYPVFPWIVADYDSETLDLNDPATFRDLSKPMGAQTPERLEQFQKRYREWDDMASTAAGGVSDDDITPPYHYGTHYSSAMIVASYLMRMEPFTQYFLRLQGGHFDLADRMFHSIKDAWWSAARNNMADVKELIPEAFYLPEFLLNSNKFELGVKQSGVPLNHVILPAWAKGDAREFIRLHRCALECDYVSAHLHEWIDLVFGFKQRGRAAEEANNVFHHLFYEGEVDLGTVEDPLRRNAIIGFINNFGQVPSQLFKKPHPAKRAPTQQQRNETLFFHHLNRLRCRMPPGRASDIGGSGAFAHQFQQHFQRNSGELLRSSVGQIVCTERMWVAVEQNKTVIPASSSASGGGGGGVGLGSVVGNSPLVRCLSWGFADGSLRVCSLETERALIVAELVPDCDEILCAACPTATLFLVAGLSGVISAFEVITAGGSTSITGAAKRAVSGGVNAVVGGAGGAAAAALALKKHLYGHYEPVTCLAASEAHGIAVSGSKDRSCIMWDLEKLSFLRQLRHHTATVAAVCINDLTGDVAVAAGASVYLWDINGRLLARATIDGNSSNLRMPTVSSDREQQQQTKWNSQPHQENSAFAREQQILSICFSQAVEWDNANVVVTGSSDGVVRFWSEVMLPDETEPRSKAESFHSPSLPDAVQSSSSLMTTPLQLDDALIIGAASDPVVARRRLSARATVSGKTNGSADLSELPVDGREDKIGRRVLSDIVIPTSSASHVFANHDKFGRRRHTSLDSQYNDRRGGNACNRNRASNSPDLLMDASPLQQPHWGRKSFTSAATNVFSNGDALMERANNEISGGADFRRPFQTSVAGDAGLLSTDLDEMKRNKAATTAVAALASANLLRTDDVEQAGTLSLAPLNASTYLDAKNVRQPAPHVSGQRKWKRQLVLRATCNVQETVHGRNRRYEPGDIRNFSGVDSPSRGGLGASRVGVTALGISKDNRILYVGDSRGCVTAWTLPTNDGEQLRHHQ